MFHWHMTPLTWPPYSPDLITMGRFLWGSIKGSLWLYVTTPPMQSCAELWKMPFTLLCHKLSDTFYRGHGGASAGVSSIRVCMQMCWKCSQEIHKWLKLFDCTLLGVWWLLAQPVHCSCHCNCKSEVTSGPLSGLMVAVKVICSSMGRSHIVTMDGWSKWGATKC
jgi:hypothetical protein